MSASSPELNSLAVNEDVAAPQTLKVVAPMSNNSVDSKKWPSRVKDFMTMFLA
jgi:hypothetical protein